MLTIALLLNEKRDRLMIHCLIHFDFGLKIEDYLTDYLSYKIQINQEINTTNLMQPHLINRLIEKIGDVAVNMCKYGTPGTPQFKIVRPNDDDKIDSAIQSKYRSIGMLYT